MTQQSHKICSNCGESKPITNFPHNPRSKSTKRKPYCKVCLRKRRRQKEQCIRCSSPAAPGYTRCERCLARDAEKAREKYQRLRQEATTNYGGKCKFCGEDRLVFLVIDHISGGGNKHRQTLGSGGTRIYTWLRKNNYPNGFQVLCHNCNAAKNTLGEQGLLELHTTTYEQGSGI